MAFNIKTMAISKSNAGEFTAQYEAWDDADPDVLPTKFTITGMTKAEIKQTLARKADKLKDRYDQQAAWFTLSDEIIQELKDAGII